MNSTGASDARDFVRAPAPIAADVTADAGRPLAVVIGPTAAGKSAIAMQLAQARGLAIVSADSRQLYRGFDIGTAKPSVADRALVPHFGIDVAEPSERWSAHAWAHAAESWMAHAVAQGTPPLVVGGTGFYVRALVQPLPALPELDAPRRALLQRWLAALDNAALERWCARLDPARAALGRTQRLRAIETVLLSGVRLSDAFERRPPARPVRYLVIDPGDRLGARIRVRVEAMLAAGWVDEVQRLLQDVPAEAPAWLASGYTAIREHLEGRMTLAQATEQVVIETRQYAKRQRTWCRHQLVEGPVTRLDPTAPDAVATALDWWDHLAAAQATIRTAST